jgi:hypothetical protein
MVRDRVFSRAGEVYREGGVPALAAAMGRSLGVAATRHARTFRSLRRRAVEFGIRPLLLRPRIRHLHGPAGVQYGPHELLVITVVRNGALYVKSFMEHYEALGVAHCVFLDNRSTDGTVDRLRGYSRVTILQTDAPYDRYENTMKRYLAERFSSGRWNLCADIDELFDYPHSNRLPLAGFLRYLDHHGFTAVVAQMLDMFPDVPIGALEGRPDDRLPGQHTYYDVSAVDRRPYEWSRAPATVRMHWGGIRRTVFGTDNGLTKAALVRMDGRVRPFVEWHQATGASVADVTGVLRHYPFAGTFREKVEDAVRSGRYGATTTDEYRAYARGLARAPVLQLKGPNARQYDGLEPLLADGFLVASEQYRRWVEAYDGGRTEDVRR